jgi:hypothetical protein
MDYSKACIYKICCKDVTIKDVYVGSTTNLAQRRAHHKGACNRPDNKGHNRPVYQFIRETGGWNGWEVVKIEDYSCDCDEDMRRCERRWLETLQATLNGNNPFTGIVTENQEEYRKVYNKVYKQEHKEELAARANVYQQEHKAEIEAKKSVKVTCEHCQSVVRKDCLVRHRKSAKCRRVRGEIE